MSERRRVSDKMSSRLERTSPVVRHVGDGTASTTGEAATKDVKPVRITVDLTQSQHRALRIFVAEHKTDGTKVVRACLDELFAGGAFADAITARLTTD